MKIQKIDFVCPLCQRKLGEVYKDDKVHKLACKACDKWIWRDYFSNEIIIKPIPEQTCSSGKRFY